MCCSVNPSRNFVGYITALEDWEEECKNLGLPVSPRDLVLCDNACYCLCVFCLGLSGSATEGRGSSCAEVEGLVSRCVSLGGDRSPSRSSTIMARARVGPPEFKPGSLVGHVVECKGVSGRPCPVGSHAWPAAQVARARAPQGAAQRAEAVQVCSQPQTSDRAVAWIYIKTLRFL